MTLTIMKPDDKSYQPINISEVEKKYNASYVGDFCIKTKTGNWSDEPVAIFYVANPNTDLGHSHYFGLFESNNTIFITNGESAFSEPIVGIIDDDNEVIFSRYRHDYRTSHNNPSIFIDGGRDYTRFGVGHHRLVKLYIDKDKLAIDPTSIDNSFKN